MQQHRGHGWRSRFGERLPDGRDHTQDLSLVELEGVTVGRDPDNVSSFEDGLETDSLLSDVGGSAVRASLGATTNPADGLDIVFIEAFLITVDPQTPILVCQRNTRFSRAILVVVGILDELEEEMRRLLVQLICETGAWLDSRITGRDGMGKDCSRVKGVLEVLDISTLCTSVVQSSLFPYGVNMALSLLHSLISVLYHLGSPVTGKSSPA